MHPAAAPFHRQRPLAHAQNPVRPRESRLAWYPQPGAVIVRPTKQGPPLLPTPLPPWTPRVGLGSPAASTLSMAGENMQSASAEPMGLIHTIKRPLQPCPPGSSKPSATDSKEAVASLARALAPAPAMWQVGAVGHWPPQPAAVVGRWPNRYAAHHCAPCRFRPRPLALHEALPCVIEIRKSGGRMGR